MYLRHIDGDAFRCKRMRKENCSKNKEKAIFIIA